MSSAEYYAHGTFPVTSSSLSSSVARSEFDAITSGISAKLPDLAGNGLKIVGVNAGATALTAVATTGTGSVVLATNATLATPTLGVAAATSINKVAITAPATSATLAIADGKTFTASNTVTLTAVDGSTLAIGAGGTLGTAAYTASSAYVTAAAVIDAAHGGTGVANNVASTLTISGSFATTVTVTGITGVTLPTSGTLAKTTQATDTFGALTDIVTNNVSATAHGFAPKFPNNTTTFLRGDGTYAAPAASSPTWLLKTANYTAVAGDFIYCDTTGGAFTITLPLSPASAAAVTVASGPSCSTNNLTIGRNSQTIRGVASNLTISDNNVTPVFIFDATTWGIA